MKILSILTLAMLFVSCASQDRKIASEDRSDLYQLERAGDFGPGYRN